MHFCIHMRWRSFVRGFSTPLFLRVQVRDGGLMLPHVSPTLRRSSGGGPNSGVHTRKTPEPAGDQEQLSVGTPKSSSTVTAVSESDGKVVGRRSVWIGKTRRWKTSTVRKN
ncbi:hypothetical protein EVAR_40396_1 [Eumeta japonica]|uniref:Uncharacterized protein n=1 Tax=Eumeta variegata TaxID=151549 RepID=A0A4C1WBW5_EUMVA|nr:hypothetical protein EVAR_40396_1 [Eumeta japonica]